MNNGMARHAQEVTMQRTGGTEAYVRRKGRFGRELTQDEGSV